MIGTTQTTNNGTVNIQGAQHLDGILGAGTTWRIDPGTTRVEFTIRKRFMFVRNLTVTGRFTNVSGTITLDESDPATAQAEVTISAASIDTGNQRRDAHLRAPEFLHIDQHPTLSFRSCRIETLDRATGHYRVTGDLTIRGVTRQVALDTRYMPAQQGGRIQRIKLALTTSLNRRDFGIIWNKSIINIADELDLTLAVEASRA